MAEFVMGEAEAKRGLTLRALIIGAVGSAVLTASSLYIALKMGALPWPIVFAALASVVALRALGSRDLHEANVCHAAMSAGAMVAGGLAFTVPALWMVEDGSVPALPEVLLASLAGTCLGLVASAVLQPYFIRQKRLAYPIGLSAADTLKATGESGGRDAKALFGAMGASGVFALLRDNFGLMPSVVGTGAVVPGATLGFYNSPMLAAMGFTVGPVPAFMWLAGGVVGTLLIAGALPALGVLDAADAASVQSSLGLGLMLGVGAGVVVQGLVPVVRKRLADRSDQPVEKPASRDARSLHPSRGVVAAVVVLVAAVASWALGLGPVASVVVILGAWFSVYLSAWLTGTTGVNPMEIFGVLVLLLVRLIGSGASLESLFLGAAVVAVACGIAGDVMNDLKAGDVLETDPRDQFCGMAVGALVGAVIAPLMLMALVSVSGASAFGADGEFVAAQASVVATMAGGIPFAGVFAAGLVAGFVMAVLGLPVMTLGLGVYLPFYMGATAALGAVARLVYDRRVKARGLDAEQRERNEATAQAVASGILGGESLVGVLTALVAVAGLVAA